MVTMAAQETRDERARNGGGQDDRGREAQTPTQVPPKGWLDVGKRTMKEVSSDNVSLLAAGCAYFAMLALFPTLIAAVTLYSLVADPGTLQNQINSIASALPEGGQIIEQQLRDLTGDGGRATGVLSIGLVISLLGALWSASGGTAGMMQALNLAYDEVETRKFLKLRGTALALTIGGIIVALIAVGLVAVLPAILDSLGLGSAGRTVVNILRWPLVALVFAGALAVLYRYAPDRDQPKFSWVSVGAGVATLLWLVASGLFSFYISNFGEGYGRTYGAIAGVIILLLWLYLSAFIILFGAELNAELERQTKADTTSGPDAPMGQRRAQAADTLGEATS